MKKKEKSRVWDIPANAIITPIEILLAVLLLFIIILVFEVNRSSNELADLTERSGVYQKEVMDLNADSSTLAETSVNFIQSPVDGEGSPIVGPLKAYAKELGMGRLAKDIAERFQSYDVSDEVKSNISNAAGIAETMLELQNHALALVRSVYTLPPIPELDIIPDVPLTEEEQAMSEEARIGLAKSLVLNGEFSQMKYHIAENVNASIGILQQSFSERSAEIKQHVGILRSGLWAVIIAIIVILFFGTTLIRLTLVNPLRKHAEEIAADQNMTENNGVREMRVLVNAYNALLTRRARLETILRSAAETDALTGLQNRYSLEQNILDSGEDRSSMAVIVFDVNFLKETNDSKGHLAGDRLLCTSGRCICECFGTEDGTNCYRVGGDEFFAVLRGCTEKEVKARLARFKEALSRENISIAVGYAFAEEGSEDVFNMLTLEADRYMYENKKEIHAAHGYAS